MVVLWRQRNVHGSVCIIRCSRSCRLSFRLQNPSRQGSGQCLACKQAVYWRVSSEGQKRGLIYLKNSLTDLITAYWKFNPAFWINVSADFLVKKESVSLTEHRLLSSPSEITWVSGLSYGFSLSSYPSPTETPDTAQANRERSHFKAKMKLIVFCKMDV